MALRHIFAQDDDFKESMFARQIAVMKGQAWNVVETLKQPDHGPLELTRRTRVCVWDDLVDVPVAIPMRAPSIEISRNKKTVRIDDQQEEMDIGAGYTSATSHTKGPSLDLLGSPTTDLPNPNRFDLTRDDSTADLGRLSSEGPTSPATIQNIEPWGFHDLQAREARDNLSNSMTLPVRPPAHKSRFSFEFSRKPQTGRRQRSGSTRSARPNQQQSSTMYEDDDLEGDLGYAAASDMEGHRRKVIVERLEAVKSKNPVFTWC